VWMVVATMGGWERNPIDAGTVPCNGSTCDDADGIQSLMDASDDS
jgi:hypothetical protein